MKKKKRKPTIVPVGAHPSVPAMPGTVVQRTTHIEITISGPQPSPEEVDKLVKDKTLSLGDALEFYEALVEDIREMYGTDDPEELMRLAMESEDLWLEEHVHDLEMYHALKQRSH